MSKLPKFITRLLEEKVSLVIQVCHDIDLKQRGVWYDRGSQLYKDSLYAYSEKVRNELLLNDEKESN